VSSADRSTTEDLGEADALDALPGAETPESPSAAPAFPRIKKRRQGPYDAQECGGQPPADFLKGIHEFNAGEFFEQHETLELLWRATESDVRYLYQGVLLIGVGFYHQQQGNFHGTQAKLAAGIEMLEWFAPACQTVDVADLIARARVCLDQVRALGRERLSEFDRSLIPQVKRLV
jgi:predicted metal-dependent hydrolase